ncbi:MAG: hypothetical protein AAF699_11535 [Pseudomonadota bacterium]
MTTSVTYILYIGISIAVTVLVSRTLSKNGEIYLIDGFNGNAELARSVNHMLVVGFYLLNIGFVLLRLQTSAKISGIEAMIVYLSSSIGLVLLVLGAIHFLNMLVIHRFREAGLKKSVPHRSGGDMPRRQVREQSSAVQPNHGT